jgi:hypothetical protein
LTRLLVRKGRDDEGHQRPGLLNKTLNGEVASYKGML